jgi:hypothetical protein
MEFMSIGFIIVEFAGAPGSTGRGPGLLGVRRLTIDGDHLPIGSGPTRRHLVRPAKDDEDNTGLI